MYGRRSSKKCVCGYAGARTTPSEKLTEFVAVLPVSTTAFPANRFQFLSNQPFDRVSTSYNFGYICGFWLLRSTSVNVGDRERDGRDRQRGAVKVVAITDASAGDRGRRVGVDRVSQLGCVPCCPILSMNRRSSSRLGNLGDISARTK